eukprot:3201188-Amphidinium_carterae.1
MRSDHFVHKVVLNGTDNRTTPEKNSSAQSGWALASHVTSFIHPQSHTCVKNMFTIYRTLLIQFDFNPAEETQINKI